MDQKKEKKGNKTAKIRRGITEPAGADKKECKIFEKRINC